MEMYESVTYILIDCVVWTCRYIEVFVHTALNWQKFTINTTINLNNAANSECDLALNDAA